MMTGRAILLDPVDGIMTIRVHRFFHSASKTITNVVDLSPHAHG